MVGWQSKQGKCISFEKSDQIEKLLFLSIMQIFQEFFDRLISHGTRKLTYYSNLIKFIFSNYSIQMVLLFHFFESHWYWEFFGHPGLKSRVVLIQKDHPDSHILFWIGCQIILLTYMCCSSQIIQAREMKMMSTPQLKWPHQFTTGK